MAKHTLAQPADKQQIVDRLQKIQPDSQRRWGTMTVNEMLCHLADSFRVIIGEKAPSPVKEKLIPVPVPVPLMKWIALDLPLPWPKGLKTTRAVDPHQDGTKPSDFAADMCELKRLLDRFAHQPRDFEWRPHPLFGSLSDDHWLRWGYLHMDHHLRQFGA